MADPVEPSESQDDTAKSAPVSVWATLGSVLAAFFGVQNSRTRKRDFTRGSPVLFFVVALSMTALFVLSLIGIVQWVLHTAQH